MATPTSSRRIKFHYGYGGVITHSKYDDRLTYSGGTNKILAVDYNITYTELVVKLWDVTPSMRLWCKLPLDNKLLLVSSDKDLAYVKKLYDQCDEKLKIRVILDYHLRFYLDNDRFYGFQSKDCTKQSHTIGDKVIDGLNKSMAVL